MSGAFETNVDLLCFSSADDALANATKAAANCGGLVVEVGRIEVNDRWVSFHGGIPRLMGRDRFRARYSDHTACVMTKPPLPCSLSTTWSNILKPEQQLGYLALNDFGPITKVVEVEEWDADTGPYDHILCQFHFERTLFSLPPKAHGLTYCEMCGVIIPVPRVLAVPGVRHCVKCQDNMEKCK